VATGELAQVTGEDFCEWSKFTGQIHLSFCSSKLIPAEWARDKSSAVSTSFCRMLRGELVSSRVRATGAWFST
jgi:hypothetical protein